MSRTKRKSADREGAHGEMPFLDHLEELRIRILWSAMAIGIGTIIGIVAAIRFDLMELFTAPLFSVVEELAREDPIFLGMLAEERLTFLNLTEPFFFILKIGMMAGVVLASPVVVYQMWAFLAPALEKRERKVIMPTLALGLVLFAAGVSLAYFVVLPTTIEFLLLFGAEWFTPSLTAGYYLSLVNGLLLAFGLAFELPVVLLILTVLGLVSSRFLREKRRHAIVAITVLACFLSPGDAFQVSIFLMVPLIVLYELGIVLSAFVERRQGRGGDGAGAPGERVPVFGVLALATYSWKSARQGAR